VFRLVVDTPVALGLDGYAGGYPEDSLLWIVNGIYFQYYSLLIFLIASAVLVGVSYATQPPDADRLRDLTFATITEEHRRESRASWTRVGVINSCLVLALILAAYLYFTG
jgi:SSS family solute:Na+ symporter